MVRTHGVYNQCTDPISFYVNNEILKNRPLSLMKIETFSSIKSYIKKEVLWIKNDTIITIRRSKLKDEGRNYVLQTLFLYGHFDNLYDLYLHCG